jgi:hypothetical protein
MSTVLSHTVDACQTFFCIFCKNLEITTIRLNNFMDEYYDNSELENAADSILAQLKSGCGLNKPNSLPTEVPELKAEDVDDFVLKYGAKAVIELSSALHEQTKLVRQTGDDKAVIALAELANSFRATLEVLQKKTIAKEKNENAVKIKQMEIDNRLQAQEIEQQDRIRMSREELLKLMLSTKDEPIKSTETARIVDV